MHNGGIADFHLIKRKLQAVLSDDVFEVVQGNTGRSPFGIKRAPTDNPCSDSEWAFALFLAKVLFYSDPI